MKVTLNIENDDELRAYIKDCIKGQVLSIVREEFKQIVQDEIERKIKGSDMRNFERMQLNATTEAIRSILSKEHSISRYNNNFIKPFIEEELKTALRNTNWNKIVEELAKEKIRLLINS